MGFYGNLIYNTYGMQEGSVKPEHLDREYWTIKDEDSLIGENGLRKFLGLSIVQNETDNEWNLRVNKAEKNIYKFHFASDTELTGDAQKEQQALRNLYGSGMLLGWIRTTSNGTFLYFISMGDRTGQIFTYELKKSALNNVKNYSKQIDACSGEAQWINSMLKNTITTSQLKNNAIISDKITNGAITEPKFYKGAVSTRALAEESVTPEKIQGEYLRKIRVWDTIETWSDFSTKIKYIGNKTTIGKDGGSLYFILGIEASLPSFYNNLNSSEKVMERCLAWASSDTTFFILDCYKGRMWRVKKNTSSTGNKVISENGVKYKIDLLQIIGPQIADNSISTSKIIDGNITEPKLHEDAVSTRTILNKNITPEKLQREHLEKAYEPSITSWSNFCSKVKTITETNTEKSRGGSVCFIGEIIATLPTKYNYLSDNTITDCIAWSSGNNTYYILDFAHNRTWTVIKNASLSGTDSTTIVKDGNDNVNYQILLHQIDSNQILNGAITKEKLSSDLKVAFQTEITVQDLVNLYNENITIPSGARLSLGAEGMCLFLERVENIQNTGFDSDQGYGVYKILQLSSMKILYLRPYRAGGGYGGRYYYNYETKTGPNLAGANIGKPNAPMLGQFYYDYSSEQLFICAHLDDDGPKWKVIGTGVAS